jgi:hypothetical protein
VTAVGVAETNAVIVRKQSADLRKIFMMLQKYPLKDSFLACLAADCKLAKGA